MAKSFNSVEEVTKYIKKQIADSMPTVGLQVEDDFREAIKTEVYDAYDPKVYQRTYDLLHMVNTTDIENDSVTVKIEDTGGHYSVITGEHFYAPYALENDYTWGRGETNIEEVANENANQNAKKILASELKSKGLKLTLK